LQAVLSKWVAEGKEPPRCRYSSAMSFTTVEPIDIPGRPPNNATYSQATRCGDLLFVSGQLGVDPATRQLVPGGLSAETRQALDNIAAILMAAGSDLSHVARVNIYITRFELLPAMNEVYAEYFAVHKPAKTTVEVSRLDRDAMIEIEVIAAAGIAR
jgi:2-iminobutanoate/2-iminopropanoate deaminase